MLLGRRGQGLRSFADGLDTGFDILVSGKMLPITRDKTSANRAALSEKDNRTANPS